MPVRLMGMARSWDFREQGERASWASSQAPIHSPRAPGDPACATSLHLRAAQVIRAPAGSSRAVSTSSRLRAIFPDYDLPLALAEACVSHNPFREFVLAAIQIGGWHPYGFCEAFYSAKVRCVLRAFILIDSGTRRKFIYSGQDPELLLRQPGS